MTTRFTRPRLALCRALLLLVAVTLGALAAASPASAHAVLVSSDPADGSRLPSAPARVHLLFDEPVEAVPGTAVVISADGTRVSAGPARSADGGAGLVIPLRTGLSAGSYLVTWRVVSADSHVVAGSVSFGVRRSATAVGLPGTTGSGRASLDRVADAATGVTYLGVVLALGVPAVGLLLWPGTLATHRVRLLRAVGWSALAAGALGALLLAGPRATGSGWSGVVRFDDLGQTLGDHAGISLLVRLGLLGVLAAAGWRLAEASTARRGLAAGAGLGVLVTIALVGHAAVGADRWVAVPAAVVHLGAMALWLGGLALLVTTVLRPGGASPAGARPLQRWSRLALASVAALVATGTYQAWRQVDPLPSLWSTGYGRTLLVKLALVLTALGLAFLARRTLGTRPSGPSTLRRWAALEAGVTMAVVAATAALVSEPPASATYGPSVTLTATMGADHLVIRVAGTRHGPQDITVTPVDARGRPLHLQRLVGHLSSAENGVSALDVRWRRGPGETWHSVAATAPVAGRWTLTLDATVDLTEGYATQASYTAW